MQVLPIVTWPDPRLSTPCSPVAAPEAEQTGRLAADMLNTMYHAQGRGLAAPQVGVLQRLFVMDVTWKEGTRRPCVCINPEIVARSATTAPGPEGCLSIPGVTVDVPRADWVELAFTGLDGQRRTERLTGFAAICAQHELDHLDGIVTFDRLSPEARAAAESSYAVARP
jgi:peptide deformylase